MTHERIDALLKAYRYSKGRLGHVIAEIKSLTIQLERERRDMVDTMASPKPQQITDMPRGTQVGNPTERLGLMLASDYKTAEMRDLETRLAALEYEREDYETNVQYVDSWLEGLQERESWIVRNKVIDEQTWATVSRLYHERFGEDCSKFTLKRLRAKALEKIYEIAK